ncbi:DUF6702 family protein [Aureispira anguillae]|uniref:Uncharacterized protein n=1 Tax=Aureispira anguillae TaxID=2864201 RepID=A0A915YKE9_9BACT|nr:DUF6702 family protein [Aureispira anguillae]BDS14433.1 hypothetical protein AsAng_0052130 [Aureispira anguillae]
MGKQFTILLFISLFLLAFGAHPIYISTTEIDYNKDQKRLEIAIKVFSDDLENILTKQKGTAIEIGTEKEHEKATDYIIEYMRTHFKLELNGRVVDFNYVNRKLVRDDFFAMWVLLEVPKVYKIKTLNLTNNILMDLNEGQQNFIKFREKRDEGYIRKLASDGAYRVTLK